MIGKVVIRLFPLLGFDTRSREVTMKRDKESWLDRYSVTCRVFKGRWSIRHCLRIYSEIRDLKIEMVTRGRGGPQRHESSYNPCEHCVVLASTLRALEAERAAQAQSLKESTDVESWAACG